MSKYLPYHQESCNYARELTKDMPALIDRYKAIKKWLSFHIMYDPIRAATIPKKNGLPDVNYCWRNRRGICLDIAAMGTMMMRAVGINAYMCWGKADGQNHAWIEADIGGRRYRYDHDGKAKKYVTERRF